MNIYTGQKSPVLKLTSNNVNQRLAPRNISIEGEYLGTKLKSTFRCSDGHVWQAKAYSVLHGSGCPECSGNIKWTKEEINNLLWNRGLQIPKFARTLLVYNPFRGPCRFQARPKCRTELSLLPNEYN